MYRLLLFTCLFLVATTSDLPTPIKSGKRFSIYRASDLIQKRTQVKEVTERSIGIGKEKRTIIEYPIEDNSTIPEDYGGNYGDTEFTLTEKDGFLLARETIINAWYPYDITLYYNQTLEGLYVKDFKVLNFGRQRGWSWFALISHYDGYVETYIDIPAGNEVRIFAEIYGDLLENYPF